MNRSWRRDAKNVLYGYYQNLRCLKKMKDDLIWAQSPRRDQRYHGGLSDPTAVKIMKMEDGTLAEIQKEVAAVKTALAEMAMKRRDSKYKLPWRRWYISAAATACTAPPPGWAYPSAPPTAG